MISALSTWMINSSKMRIVVCLLDVISAGIIPTSDMAVITFTITILMVHLNYGPLFCGWFRMV